MLFKPSSEQSAIRKSQEGCAEVWANFFQTSIAQEMYKACSKCTLDLMSFFRQGWKNKNSRIKVKFLRTIVAMTRRFCGWLGVFLEKTSIKIWSWQLECGCGPLQTELL